MGTDPALKFGVKRSKKILANPSPILPRTLGQPQRNVYDAQQKDSKSKNVMHNPVVKIYRLPIFVSLVKYLEGLRELSKGAKDTLASGESLHSETEESNHRQTGMLDLGLLELESTLRVGSEVKGVEVTAGVATLDGVKLGVTVELNGEHEDSLDPAQLGQGEGEVKPEVCGAIKLNLAGIHPAGKEKGCVSCIVNGGRVTS